MSSARDTWPVSHTTPATTLPTPATTTTIPAPPTAVEPRPVANGQVDDWDGYATRTDTPDYESGIEVSILYYYLEIFLTYPGVLFTG